jgi:hypothetical protein
MYHFFSESTGGSGPDTTQSFNPWSPETIGLAIGMIVVISGGLCCGWSLYRRWRNSETATVTPTDNTVIVPPNRAPITTVVTKNNRGEEVFLERTYPDGSTLRFDPNLVRISITPDPDEVEVVPMRSSLT